MFNRIFKIIFIFGFFGISSICLAGFETGNGGDVVICFDNQDGPRLLDLFEVQLADDVTIPSELSDKTFNQIVADRLLQLRRVDVKRSNRLEEIFAKFSEGKIELVNEIPAIFDSGYVVELPANCMITQLAIQVPYGEAFEDIKVYLSESIWNNMKPLDRAALFFHEALYRDAVLQGMKDSFQVRRFVRKIFSQEFESLDQGEYEIFLQSIQFDSENVIPEVAALAENLDKLLGEKTLVRNSVDQLRNDDQQIANVSRKEVYGKVQKRGKSVFVDITSYVDSTVWDYDPILKVRSNKKNSKRLLKSKWKYIYMGTTKEFLVEKYPISDSRLGSSRGISIGKVLEVTDSSLKIEFRSARYTEFKGPRQTRYPGFVRGESTFSIVGGGLVKNSVVKNYRLNGLPSDFSDSQVVTEYNLTSKELIEQ